MRRLLIIGPSFRRRKDPEALPAIERYDGLFFRVARKYLKDIRTVDVLVMKDDLTMVDAQTPLPYTSPKGERWGMKSITKASVEKARVKNETFLNRQFKGEDYSEI